MKNVIIGIAIVAAVAYLTSNAANAKEVDDWHPDYGPYNDKAVKSAAGTKLYKIVRGLKVEYVSQQAYVNDGSPQVITLPDAEFEKMGEITNAKIYETGYKQG